MLKTYLVVAGVGETTELAAGDLHLKMIKILKQPGWEPVGGIACFLDQFQKVHLIQAIAQYDHSDEMRRRLLEIDEINRQQALRKRKTTS
jgi:hypothetical protein